MLVTCETLWRSWGFSAHPLSTHAFTLCLPWLLRVSYEGPQEMIELDITCSVHAGNCPETCESCLTGSS